MGLINDYPSLAFEFLFQPAILGYFSWIQTAPGEMFQSLLENDIFTSNSHTSKILEDCKDKLQSKRTAQIASLLSLLFISWFIVQFLTSPPHKGWITAHPALVWLRSPIYLIQAYAFILFIFDLMIIIRSLNCLFRGQRIRVKPFHPDNAGGIGSVGSFSANLGFLIGILGIILSLIIVFQVDTYLWIISIIIYLVLTPLIFFAPLLAAHSAMRIFRDRHLSHISQQLEITYTKGLIQTSTSPPTHESIKEKLDKLLALRDLTSKFPTWPFNVSNIRKYFSIVLPPSAPGAVLSIIKIVREGFLS